MRRYTWIPVFLLLFSLAAWANGVCIIDATTNTHLTLQRSLVSVQGESQIAIVTATQGFINLFSDSMQVKYAFPLPEGASAIELRWQHEGQWYLADVAAEPDTTLPGSGSTVHPDLEAYLGETPLFFSIPQYVKADSTVKIELTYVQLLPYSFGNVDFYFPNDYQLIQSSMLIRQELFYSLVSPRTINTIQLLSGQTVTQLVNNGNDAFLHAELLEAPAAEDYHLRYSLDLNQLGLFDYSTLVDTGQVRDSLGRGYLTFIAEPDPGTTTDVIDKVFTLIIDRSGSMSGNKIVQARNAATYITDNLNEGDLFNIVDFASGVTSFRGRHVPYTPASRDSALGYISTIMANGGTNISSAFTTAIPQFATANDSTANIIIFFTDGQATVGITNTQQLLAHVQNLVTQTETDVSIFTFGIGLSVNQQLLTLLATQNNGLAEFLMNDELFARITAFYLRIRNPVLLNTSISFDPPLISEVYPQNLPNLYKGQQMIISGRFIEGVPVNITLSGEAFGQPVSYQYSLNLADSSLTNYQFLPKVWAKSKIEHLLLLYYALDPTDPQAEALRAQIIQISQAYGVISPFTSFSGGTPVGIEEDGEIPSAIAADFELLGNYPNPFNPVTTIRIRVHRPEVGFVKINIFNALGQLVRVLIVPVNGGGVYEVSWDGQMLNGRPAASGHYFYSAEMGRTVLFGKMTLLK